MGGKLEEMKHRAEYAEGYSKATEMKIGQERQRQAFEAEQADAPELDP